MLEIYQAETVADDSAADPQAARKPAKKSSSSFPK